MCSWHFLQLNIFNNRCKAKLVPFPPHFQKEKVREIHCFFFVCECVLVCRKCKKVAHRTVFGQVDLEHELDPDSDLSGLKIGNLLSRILQNCVCKKVIKHYPCFKCLHFDSPTFDSNYTFFEISELQLYTTIQNRVLNVKKNYSKVRCFDFEFESFISFLIILHCSCLRACAFNVRYTQAHMPLLLTDNINSMVQGTPHLKTVRK